MTRFRRYTCKIIILTSVVWFMIGVLILMYYTECAGSKNLCGKRTVVVKSSHPEEDDASKSPNAPKGKFAAWEASGNILYLYMCLYLFNLCNFIFFNCKINYKIV